ncbi:MAG: hypothetical protein J5605_02025 [Bacteroidales bacterium]|nr:hypothetical protein [Bacteroidales bacterium]
MARIIRLTAFLLMAGLCMSVSAQQTQDTKRERKKNLTIKEYKQKTGSKVPRLDDIIRYDANGRKVEEIEYSSNGSQKSRVVYEYDDKGVCTRELVYNHKNKVQKIRKIEYNADGTRHKIYVYSPKGNLETTRTFEYSY